MSGDTVHATAVARGQDGVLLLGPPGAGKSDLALRLVAAGWRLVADDRVVVRAEAGQLVASAPPTLAGQLEVRGLGIVPEPTAPAIIRLALDLGQPPERVPAPAQFEAAGLAVPLIGFDPVGASAVHRVTRALENLGQPGHNSAMEPARPLLIVSGMSGAGKTTALKALEDLGHEVVDNLPMGLVDPLIAATAPGRPLAIGIDVRTRAFDPAGLVARLRMLKGGGLDIRLVWLDAGDEVLIRRFSETRRRHPLLPDRPPADGIVAERALVAPLRKAADLVIDTSDMSATALRRAMADRLGLADAAGLSITVTSFGFAAGLPRDADLVFDMRFLANPHWQAELRPLTGLDPRVAAYVASDPLYEEAVARITGLIATLIPGYAREGKAWLAIAIGCTGGQHRSVATACDLAARLTAAGHSVALSHRDIDTAPASTAAGPDAPLTLLPLGSTGPAS
jgi:RNase adaptor protein for sRNA GlmZ degradation